MFAASKRCRANLSVKNAAVEAGRPTCFSMGWDRGKCVTGARELDTSLRISVVRGFDARGKAHEACEAAEVRDIHLHDLRHALGQWSANAGVSEAHIQQAMRHVTPSMTRRYTMQKAKGEVASAMSKALKKGA